MKKNITKKQKEVYDFIKNYIRDYQISPSQKEIKDHFKLKSFGSVQKYIKYLSAAGYLQSNWNEKRGLKLGPESKDSSKIPLLGHVAAGDPILAMENPYETIEVPKYMISKQKDNCFALSVKGLSMIDEGILEGDVIVCRQTQNVKDGQIIVAVLEGEATVKTYFKKAKHIELRPANKTMKPILVHSGDFTIAGVVIGLIRDYGH
ncbi:MAG: transcriptional repressor LexA [Halobacteriovoraceae bacterium]|nr:transcriptional repressor LexA [Halobacteriovoraceae bacterium]